MKKLIILFLPVFLFTSTAFSQEVSYGFNVGFNYYSFFTETNEGEPKLAETSMSTNLQYHLGGYIDIPIDSNFGIIGNVVYQNRSVELPENQDTRLDYLDINPLLKYDLNGSYGQGVYLKAGVRYSILLSAKLFEDLQDVSGEFNKSNFGVDLGIGYDITKAFGVELILDYSPTDFSEEITSQLAGVDFRFIIDLQDLLAS
jgi:hypothetical protein